MGGKVQVKYFYKVSCSDCQRILMRKNRCKFKCSFCKNGKKIPNWNSIRISIMKRDGGCVLCKTKERLHVHHKNSNRYNNSEENLITLCIQCHLSQHKTKFKKIIGIKRGEFGNRLIYQ